MKHAKCRMNPVAGVLLAVLLLWQAGLSGCDFSAPALYTAPYMDVFDTVLTLRIASTSRTAADNAAEFVALAIQKTPYDQDTRFGVWFEPLLPRLCPLREE